MHKQLPESIALTAVSLALALCLCCPAGCTKKIVRQKGIYSKRQLPKETQTPVLDAIDQMIAPEPD